MYRIDYWTALLILQGLEYAIVWQYTGVKPVPLNPGNYTKE